METTKKKRILLVDDDAAIRRIVSTSLRLLGYDVITSGSGKEALTMGKSEKPDIILLDVFMPEMNGFEVLETLRKTSKTPVIFFSAHSSVREQALKQGANDFVAKPFTPAQMAKRISAVLQSNNN